MNCLFNIKNYFCIQNKSFINIVRFASKKTGGSTRNTSPKVLPKHRGWKKQDRHFVTAGFTVATQNKLRFLPGLNVGFGKNGSLYALSHGHVYITCEKADVNWNHTWVQRCLSHKKGTPFFKKYFNVIPEPQHQNFKLIDEI